MDMTTLIAQKILAALAFVLVVVEIFHAKEEARDAFKLNPAQRLTGLVFYDMIDRLHSKTEVAFVTHKAMMVLQFIIIALFAYPSMTTKIVAFAMIGLYLLYQWHHLYEWYIRKKDNHGRRTAWLYVPTAIVWWWMVVILIKNLLNL